MKTINVKIPKLYSLIDNIDFSTEESYNSSLKNNFEELSKICHENDMLDIQPGGISGFEKEKNLSIRHVKRIENTKNIEYEKLKETKEILYSRAKKRLNSKKHNEITIHISSPKELTKHIISVAMDVNEKYHTVALAKVFPRNKRNNSLKRILVSAKKRELKTKNQKIKNINETLVTRDMVGQSIGDVFGRIIGPIFDEKKDNRQEA